MLFSSIFLGMLFLGILLAILNVEGCFPSKITLRYNVTVFSLFSIRESPLEWAKSTYINKLPQVRKLSSLQIWQQTESKRGKAGLPGAVFPGEARRMVNQHRTNAHHSYCYAPLMTPKPGDIWVLLKTGKDWRKWRSPTQWPQLLQGLLCRTHQTSVFFKKVNSEKIGELKILKTITQGGSSLYIQHNPI